MFINTCRSYKTAYNLQDILKMNAPHPQESSLRINFGNKQSGTTPLQLSVIIDLFSQEQAVVKEAIATEYKADIPSSCIMFELAVKQDSANIANTIDKLRQQFNSDMAPAVLSTYILKNRVLGVIQAEDFQAIVKETEQHFCQLKQEAKQEGQPISLRVSSHNSLEAIGQKLKEEGFGGWLDSLHLQFSFVKNGFISKVLTTFCSKVLQNDQYNPLINSFKQCNLEINFESSSYLKNFSKIKGPKVVPIESSSFDQLLNELEPEKGRFWIMNPTLFVKGDLNMSGLDVILKLLLQ